MENKLSVGARIQKARVMLQQRDLKKSGQNSFSKYTYFELKDFLPAINEILDELSLFSYVDINDEIGILTIFDSENPEKFVQFTMPSAKVELKGGNAIQNIGATQTYVKRYLYMNAFEIAENDIIDSGEGGKKSNRLTREDKKNAEENAEVDKEFAALLDKVVAKKDELVKLGKRSEVNKIIKEKSTTPNPNNIKTKEDLQYVLDKLNEVK